MKAACVTVLIYVASCVCVSFCYPSKPLNERSTELAWEAWLLVDQSTKQDIGMLRRRITPKSVFITPTFSPESLPACAEGYTSDNMGRCVRIVKINESAHFDFLLRKLNDQFSEYVDSPEEPVATQGPLQFNIPIAEDEEMPDDDIAIVVSPTRHHHKHHDKNTALKVEVKRTGGEKFNVEDVAAILGLKTEDIEMTTIEELTTTMLSTLGYDESTTLQATTNVEEESETTTQTITESPETTTATEALPLQMRV